MMAHSFMDQDPFPTDQDTVYTVTLKLRELKLNMTGSQATLRVGWMNSEVSVFTHWKKLEEGRVGWKSSMVQQLNADTDDIYLVIYQKVGDCEMPIGLRRIPCAGILPSQRKHLFRIPIEGMVKGQGTLTGSIRSKVYEGDMSHVAQSQSADGSVSSKSSGTGCSIDMSLDLTTEIPTVFFPVISVQEVYHCILHKHFMVSHFKDVFLKVLSSLLQCPTGVDQFVVPNACEVQELDLIDYSFLKELKITLSTSNDGRFFCFYWDVSRTDNFEFLKDVARAFLDSVQNGEIAQGDHNIDNDELCN